MNTSNLSIESIKLLLEELAFPQKNITDMTAICILALSNTTIRAGLIKEKHCLAEGARITDILQFAENDLGRTYAENTRESIRKHSLKYLIDNGMVLVNADNPNRATNSGLTNYTLSHKFNKLLLAFQRDDIIFNELKEEFVNVELVNRRAELNSLKKQHIHITIPALNEILTLSPGEHNIIEKFIVEELFQLDYHNARLVYIGDTKNKDKFNDPVLCSHINLIIDNHAKLPDVVGFDVETNTVMIYEAVASSGPIDHLRKKELLELFKDCPFTIEFFTVFLKPKLYQRYATTIAEETTVYIIESKQKIKYEAY
ncbi:BsuBI/PstI family type II restriction endonuclease [Bacillus mycoides]|uniref:BsuBI/PstI family type II restriction endonuclease n=1 Tax=Bacillus mycoides TaxID=1405 RepID=UPI000BF1E342|nr:BsuBI/PstI family type II restriction endonuclease [Bacillus mycoides]PEK94247.1 hypothetical protein CN600_11535 [Bacillus mycoides]